MEGIIADRIQWAVDVLEVAPYDRMLEIGCGPGSAVSLISRKLVDGMITAIDQSDKMIHKARKKNAEHELAGKAKFLAAKFHEAELGQSQFNKIFAVNINLFWKKADRELEIIRRRMSPEGTVYLFNQPPAADKLRFIAERTSQNLMNAGFGIKQVIVGNQKPVPVVCVIAD
ncbi:class I SAM-dependent methyltransferase [Paenibacillus allorhizosphaerae]|uniref:Trans-aconitate 2-methyltransferase n=1 Tax=Paenibacillus allorhizosphaerae TaxID=2849866 RepID=A0ABN7TME3_9BACL|nr:class I SAM-dependent methyltransferase [Paenibacillus allorhizosphaerae]CAG7640306.1 Trans-aconitate 2-methyltransferase [Paenibacillus allorhizosphaerae]